MSHPYLSQKANFAHFSFRCALQRYPGRDRPRRVDDSAVQWCVAICSLLNSTNALCVVYSMGTESRR